MHPLTLSILLLLTACNSQDIRLQQDSHKNKHLPDQVNNTSPIQNTNQLNNVEQFNSAPTRLVTSNGNTIEYLVIRWPQQEQPNPFSANPIRYEIWHNEYHIDTVATNSYLLALDLESNWTEPGYGCIRLRAIRGEHQSELSQPVCYSVTS